MLERIWNMISSIFLGDAPVTPEAQRMGVYILAALVGVCVSGLILYARELRRQASEKPPAAPSDETKP
jgi:hypothetical protein